ncbi:TPA: ABC transporter substrate-binding protein, partial [Candidatus Micrarchaeota archaeon]|nr:ABC transporter substrate-binding protein [Candidatus Micrarchaeota archaeon]
MDRAVSAIVLALVLMAGAPALMANAAHAAEGTLIVAQMKYIKNPNPLKEETWYDWWLNLVTFDRLFREGPDLEPHPWLCEFYAVSPDGLVWTFKVVENSKWHDGVPFTARDIAFTVEFYKKYKPPAWYPNVMYVTKVEVVDDYTVKVYLNQTFVWMKRRFGQMIILPEHIWKYVAQVFEDPMRFNPLDSEDVAKVLAVIKEEAPKEIASKVEEFVNKYGHLRIGNGPFMLVRWKEGELLEMVRAPGYFKEGFPKIDRLVYKVYATAQAQYLAVKKGEAHIMVWTVPYAVIEEAEADPNIVLPRTPDVYVGYIGLNMKDPVLENPLVRKAIAHAIDKEKIVSVLMLGYAMPAYTFIHPGYEKWVNLHVPRYEFDLDTANELLDRAGFRDVDGDGYRETPDGRDFELTIYTPSYDPVRVRIGDLMVEWFKQICIKLTNRAV